jgi:hypothetical protein
MIVHLRIRDFSCIYFVRRTKRTLVHTYTCDLVHSLLGPPNDNDDVLVDKKTQENGYQVAQNRNVTQKWRTRTSTLLSARSHIYASLVRLFSDHSYRNDTSPSRD